MNHANLIAAWDRKRTEWISLQFKDSPESEFRPLLVVGVTESFDAGFKAAVECLEASEADSVSDGGSPIQPHLSQKT